MTACASFSFEPPEIPPFLTSLNLQPVVNLNASADFCCHFQFGLSFAPNFSIGINLGPYIAVINALLVAAFALLSFQLYCPL
jgi:hypothetical protein